MVWALAEAKNRFSELFERALQEGPQRITRRGRDSVVLLSAAEYERLVRPQRSLKDHLLAMPKGDWPIERVDVVPRPIETEEPD